MIEPRGWQKVAIHNFLDCTDDAFLLEATPGAGKTIFSGLCAKAMIGKDVDFCIVVVPTTALKGDTEAGFLGDWHKVGVELTTVLKESRDPPREFAGGVITYQQLPNIVSTFETWARKNVRLFVVFDEIHHASEANTWGVATERLGEVASRVLGMTGTPFRGDGKRISFLKYDDEDTAQADYQYNYRSAVRDHVCRALVFATDDGMAEFMLNNELREVRVSESAQEDKGRAAHALFKWDADWLREAFSKADSKLDEYRTHDVDAGGIVICRPGTDEEDDRYIHQTAKMIKAITGEAPEVITHEDPDANAKIERFRKGTDRWICSVRKISEGVDIKRLRVQLMACCPGSELLFRQLVGRVVRVDDPKKPGDATVFIAKFPQLNEWARRISEEADAGINDRPAKQRAEITDPNAQNDFRAIGSTHEDGGGFNHFGEFLEPALLKAAERAKRDDPALVDTSAATIAHVMKKFSVNLPSEIEHGKPLHSEKQSLRRQIDRLAKQLAIVRKPDKPDYAAVWRMLHRTTGAKDLNDLMDNHAIDVMRQSVELLKSQLVNRDDAARSN